MKPLNNKYKVLVRLLVTVVALVFLWQGTLLFFASPDSPTYKQFGNYGLLRWMLLIGFWEVGVGVLFFIPQTSPVGYLLAMILWGGMFFLHMSQGQPVALTMYLMILATGVNYVRNPAMFQRFEGDNEKEMQKSNGKNVSKANTNNRTGALRRLPTTNDGVHT